MSSQSNVERLVQLRARKLACELELEDFNAQISLAGMTWSVPERVKARLQDLKTALAEAKVDLEGAIGGASDEVLDQAWRVAKASQHVGTHLGARARE